MTPNRCIGTASPTQIGYFLLSVCLIAFRPMMKPGHILNAAERDLLSVFSELSTGPAGVNDDRSLRVYGVCCLRIGLEMYLSSHVWIKAFNFVTRRRKSYSAALTFECCSRPEWRHSCVHSCALSEKRWSFVTLDNPSTYQLA
ncbi:hypothetical protein SISSUDRAFT_105372 [Sistotremastrum suecicum HHB10207 ss-3]|uniref:Uncharacterized protein n=1 Tax=Sistotremastrum suecicum HHB10207 ss-3 TaxID=1314776 RepID=A0A166B2L7_9AGAM|nr:hypothetical protein SISSUDRAFT_105372 [Sistotremastrum suecicum HHB10207 ss-3]